MRSIKILVMIALLVTIGATTYAELQNVEVNGQIRIRGNMYDMDSLGEVSYVEQRTRVGIKADFTDEVSGVIELDNYDNWGEDFRSNYITGVDGRAATADDVEMYQAYIQVNSLCAVDGLSLRLGRQEIALGSQWLVGVNDANSRFTGLSFDAARLTYANDLVSLDVIWAKLAEGFGDFSESDVDLYALYGSYIGIENITIDAYWMFVNDDNNLTIADNELHTLGLRGAGAIGALDFEAELAYQMGEIQLPLNDLDYSAWGANLEAGYTLDIVMQPRLYAGYVFLEGTDGEDQAFNRLFSNQEYTQFLDVQANLSNAIIYRAGVNTVPMENINVTLAATYITSDEEDSTRFLWWKNEADNDEGIEVGLYGDYAYTEDLMFRAGWAHFFASQGFEDGNDMAWNGLLPIAGDGDDDADYLFLETELKF